MVKPSFQSSMSSVAIIVRYQVHVLLSFWLHLSQQAIFTPYIGLNITKMHLCVDYKYNKNVNKRLPKSMGGTHSSVVQLTPSQRQNRKDARTIGKFDVKLTRKIFNMLCTAEEKKWFFLLGHNLKWQKKFIYKFGKYLPYDMINKHCQRVSKWQKYKLYQIINFLNF